MGELDDDGFLYLRDRKIDMIISGGVNIYPAEVEAALLSHPAVGDAAVFGIPNDDWGEEVKAVVEPAPGVAPTPALADELLAHCASDAGALQVPAQHRLHRRHAPRPEREALQAHAPRSVLGRPRAQHLDLRTSHEERSSMARVPIEEGFFRIPDDPDELPRLLGSRCPSCGEVFFPRRLVCAQCLHEGTDDVELSTRGRLWTWTYCHVPMFGKKDADVPGYGVGQVDLPEGPRVQSILLGGPDDFEIGMELEIDLETLRTNPTVTRS